jgi:uncharacterized protein DUF1844
MADEKKIIVDEDWKSQVQAEKEAAAKKSSDAPVSAAGSEKPKSAANVGDGPAFPSASFEMLVTTLATEALVALGQVPHPLSGKAELQPDQAKYLIDTLDVLQQKTKGNLTPAEQELIDSILHQMRMLFVAVASGTAKT